MIDAWPPPWGSRNILGHPRDHQLPCTAQDAGFPPAGSLARSGIPLVPRLTATQENGDLTGQPGGSQWGFEATRPRFASWPGRHPGSSAYSRTFSHIFAGLFKRRLCRPGGAPSSGRDRVAEHPDSRRCARLQGHRQAGCLRDALKPRAHAPPPGRRRGAARSKGSWTGARRSVRLSFAASGVGRVLGHPHSPRESMRACRAGGADGARVPPFGSPRATATWLPRTRSTAGRSSGSLARRRRPPRRWSPAGEREPRVRPRLASPADLRPDAR